MQEIRVKHCSLLDALAEAGYTTSAGVLNAAEYGVPQKRKRTFVIGAKDGVELDFPEATHCPKSKLDHYSGTRKSLVTAGEQ